MGNKKNVRIIRGILLIVIIVCFVQIARVSYLSIKHKKQQEQLSNSLQLENTQNDNADSRENDFSADTGILRKFEELYAVNSDLAGWLSIEGTEIDYPVVQCEDDEYYLHHNFYNEEDKYGCLFMRDYADINTPGTNVIIYGHSMKDGFMFGNLDEYESEKFYAEHKLINFDTLYEERVYEIMAVFPSRIYGEEEDVFKYYQFYQADTEEEFQDFYKNVKRLSLYDTGVTAEFGDTFITLSTCAYHVEDGRFVVVAKRQIS